MIQHIKSISCAAFALSIILSAAAFLTNSTIVLYLSWVCPAGYLVFLLLMWYVYRKKYYLFTFYSEGKVFNAFIEVRGGVDIRKLEDQVRELVGTTDNVIFVTRTRLNLFEYRMGSSHDNAEKDS